MTADWYLFWKQHYERPTISEFDLYQAIIELGFKQMAEAMQSQFAPAVAAFARQFMAMADQMRKVKI